MAQHPSPSSMVVTSRDRALHGSSTHLDPAHAVARAVQAGAAIIDASMVATAAATLAAILIHIATVDSALVTAQRVTIAHVTDPTTVTLTSGIDIQGLALGIAGVTVIILAAVMSREVALADIAVVEDITSLDRTLVIGGVIALALVDATVIAATTVGAEVVEVSLDIVAGVAIPEGVARHEEEIDLDISVIIEVAARVTRSMMKDIVPATRNEIVIIIDQTMDLPPPTPTGDLSTNTRQR